MNDIFEPKEDQENEVFTSNPESSAEEESKKSTSEKVEDTKQYIMNNQKMLKMMLINFGVLLVLTPILYTLIILTLEQLLKNSSISSTTTMILNVTIVLILIVVNGLISYSLAKKKYKIYLSARANPRQDLTFKIDNLKLKFKSWIFIGIAVVTLILTMFVPEQFPRASALPFLYIVLLAWAINHISTGHSYRCRHCKAYDLLVFKRTVKTKTEKIAIKVKNEVTDKDNQVKGHVEQYIPGTRKYYQQDYVCKWCGSTHTSYYTKDVKSV